MPLTFIGLGLSDHKDISVKGLEAITRAEVLYLESYTNVLQVGKEELETFYNKPVIIADRNLVEHHAEETILRDALTKKVCFLVIGDVFSATTHTDLYQRALEKKINVSVIHNASVLSAIGATGLSVYKFGKTTSIPFNNKDVKTPLQYLTQNQSIGAHTLFLLDLDPINNKYLSIKEAIEYLLREGRARKVEGEERNEEGEQKKEKRERGGGAGTELLTPDTTAVACARLGSPDQVITYGTLKELQEQDFGKAPYCIIIPGPLHFSEEEFLEQYTL